VRDLGALSRQLGLQLLHPDVLDDCDDGHSGRRLCRR
jgi:hypothetical protein